MKYQIPQSKMTFKKVVQYKHVCINVSERTKKALDFIRGINIICYFGKNLREYVLEILASLNSVCFQYTKTKTY